MFQSALKYANDRREALRSDERYRWHIPKLTQKNGLFCNRDQPNLFTQLSSLNIMDVLRHKRFGCSAVYDEDFSCGMKAAALGQKMDEIWMKAAAFEQKMDEWTKFGFFCQASLNAAI